MSALGSTIAPMISALGYLAPWEFSPTVAATCSLTAILYVRGMRVRARAGAPVGFWAAFSFLLGLALTYAALQTYVDYLSQHMFWVHRLQHLFLHHIGPFLMMVTLPGPVLRAGLPAGWREPLGRWERRSGLRWLLRIVQNPWIAGLLFVGMVYFWLTPSIHFTAMLDARRYLAMNWGMALDGVLFWWLMLTPRSAQGSAAVNYGPRITVLVASGFLQLFLGAFIVLDKNVLYNVYGICGRAWAISPLVDQQLGGCLTWIPPAMMSLIGVLVVIHHMLHDADGSARVRPAVRAVALAGARG